ncbi:MAG TPA: FtsX-like permease family protein [Thermoplasmata archaeon]|nr:FtsX-like permease family protein [Thermoplasmata archaeon]
MRRFRRPTHRAWQTAFAASAIAAAVALPVVLLSVGGGVSDHEIAQLEHAGYQIAVSAPGLHGIEGAHALAASIDRLSGVSAASPILSASVDAFGPNGGAIPTLAEGIVPEAFQATESASTRGLFPSPLPLGDPTDQGRFDGGSYAGPSAATALLAAPFAVELGVSAGSNVTLSPTPDRSGGETFRVSGIVGGSGTLLSPTAAFALLLPLSDLQLLVGAARANGTTGALEDLADTIQVALSGSGATDPAIAARVAQEIQALVPFYGVSELSDQVRQAESGAAVLTGFYLALSSVGLLIGLVFLAIVLVRHVENERRAIGIRRAIGVPARSIAAWVLGRGLLLGALGGGAGILGGWVLVELLDRFGSAEVRAAVDLAVFDPLTLALLGVGLLGLTALASLSAIRTALKLPIPEALR